MSLWKNVRALFRRGRAAEETDADDEPQASTGAGETSGSAARSRGHDGKPGATNAPGSAVPPVRGGESSPPDEIELLALIGAVGGPSVEDAIAILRRARGTLREAEAVAAALRGLGERAIPGPVRLACAEILAMRGEDQQALRLLEGTTLTAGLLLAAELHASSGQLARAVGTIERVLARDIEAPGAKERHARWRAALGRTAAPTRRLDEATIVAANATRGPFRLLREVARGGAGVVYEAEDEALGRRVAFKVYHGRAADRPLVEREARLAAAVAGPGVLRVLDASPAEGWVALEWVARGSVRDVLRAGDVAALLPIARWAQPLARAIARVHREGYVHADVKPGNVLFRHPNDPVLGDFGIARPRGAGGENDGGSPGYVSPERIAGRGGEPRDDVYGYGRILEDVVHRLDEAVQAGRVAVSELDAAEPWQTLALRCVGPDEGRPADGDELVRALP